MKIKFGSHTAINGLMDPFTVNDVDKVEKIIYNELSASPMPR